MEQNVIKKQNLLKRGLTEPKIAKMEKGCSPGSPVSLSGTLKSPVVYVTEGVLKAEAASQRTGQPYLGNPRRIQLQGTGIVTEPIKRTRSKNGH